MQSSIDLLIDARLSSDARIVGLFIASKGAGKHEISRDELGDVLSNDCSRDRIQRAIAQLERYKWVKRAPGGRDHFDSFEINLPENRAPKNTYLPENPAGKAAVVVEEGSSSKEPPIIPLPVKCLSAKASALIDGKYEALFEGFRGPYRDYLIERVGEDQQYPHVQLIATWMNGADMGVWRMPNGHMLPKNEWAGMMAAALNDLMQQPGGESKMTRPSGDATNLRTKINILIQKRADNGSGRYGNRQSGTRASAARPTIVGDKYGDSEPASA